LTFSLFSNSSQGNGKGKKRAGINLIRYAQLQSVRRAPILDKDVDTSERVKSHTDGTEKGGKKKKRVGGMRGGGGGGGGGGERAGARWGGWGGTLTSFGPVGEEKTQSK